jgi:hypothetical protein
MADIAQPLFDKDSSSEFERRPRIDKLRYFYKASFFSKLFLTGSSSSPAYIWL